MKKSSQHEMVSQPETSRKASEKSEVNNRYSAPHLVEYGTLAKLTRAKVAGVSEGGTMSACL